MIDKEKFTIREGNSRNLTIKSYTLSLFLTPSSIRPLRTDTTSNGALKYQKKENIFYSEIKRKSKTRYSGRARERGA